MTTRQHKKNIFKILTPRPHTPYNPILSPINPNNTITIHSSRKPKSPDCINISGNGSPGEKCPGSTHARTASIARRIKALSLSFSAITYRISRSWMTNSSRRDSEPRAVKLSMNPGLRRGIESWMAAQEWKVAEGKMDEFRISTRGSAARFMWDLGRVETAGWIGWLGSNEIQWEIEVFYVWFISKNPLLPVQ